MAEPQDWKQRLADARQRTIFEPTPSGATPYVTRLEHLCEALDSVEVCAATASSPDSPTAIICRAVAVLLREAVNARMYEQNMRARVDVVPDRVDRLCDLVETLLNNPQVPQ